MKGGENMKELVLIQLKDSCYYDDDFEYEPFLVEKDEDFQEKYQGLVNICQSYDSFEEVEDYIAETFTKVDYEQLTIEV